MLRQVPTRITLMLVGAAVVLLANAYLSYQNARSLQIANASLVHSADVLEKTARVTAQLARAGEAQRGFLLTGDEPFMAAYRSATTRVEQRLRELQAMTADNEIQQGRLNRLVPLVKERLAELEEAIAEYRENGAKAAAASVRKHEQRALGESVQAILRELQAEESTLREIRERDLSRSAQLSAVSGILAVVVGLAQLALSWYVIALYLSRQRESEERLARLNADLEKKVQARTSDLSQLSRHLMTVREDEKTKIARELHDELGSNLTAARMDLAWVAARLADNQPLAQRVARASEAVHVAVDLGRHIIHDLRPPLLDTLGIGPAIEAHVAEFRKHSELAIDVDIPEELPALVEGCPIALFRIVQEALTNVMRHAQAKHVRVSLEIQGSDLVLEIVDDGVGISQDTSVHPMSHGLLGIRERAAAFGGRFGIARGEGDKGTVLRVTLPCLMRKAA